MIYLTIFTFLLILSYTFRDDEKKNNKCFVIFLLILWLLLSFRYGQGADYFGYKYLFSKVNSFSDAVFNTNQIHSEIGFRFLYWLFGNNFELFIFTISSFEMLMLYMYINKYSVNKTFSLMLFFPVYYLVYYFSAIRQGFAIACFIGILYPLLMKKKYKEYFIGVALLSLFHSSSLILVLIPIISKLKMKYLIMLIPLTFIFGLSLCLFSKFIPLGIFDKIAYYWNGKFSFFALLYRVILFSILFLYLYLNKNKFQSEGCGNLLFFNQEIKILVTGLLCYFSLMGSPLIASRLMGYFQIIEIIFIPRLLSVSDLKLELNKKRICYILKVLLIAMVSVNCVKTLNASLSEGGYNEKTNIFNYPYISIFNKYDLEKYKNFE